MQSSFAAMKNTSLESSLASGSRWLEAGRDYEVVIEDMDASKCHETGRVVMVLRAAEGMYKDNLFVTNREKDAFSFEMRKLLGATLPNAEAQRTFRDLLASDADSAIRVLEAFRGMRVRVSLGMRPGFTVVPDEENNEYAAMLDGEEVARHTTYSELKRIAKSRGHKQAFKTITGFEVIDEPTKETNLKAFDSVVASLAQATVPEDLDATVTQGPDGVTSRW